MASILVDTGFWISLCDPRDNAAGRDAIDDIYDRFRGNLIVLPWPLAYETLRTKFVRNRIALARFEREIKSQRVRFIDDAPFREEALDLSFQSSLWANRPLSLVDCVMRLLMDDVATRIRYLITFNRRDFHDVCARRGIEILPI